MFGRVFIRQMTSLAEALPKAGKGQFRVPSDPRYKKLMEQQTRFCADDGLLVWQKLPGDVLLYRITSAMVTIASLGTVLTLYQLAAPPKND